jgi:2-haloalkanoic acid dehalogenase type II
MFSKTRAVFFDFMGTCLDWHSSVIGALPPAIPQSEASKFALEWRQRYFISNAQRLSRGQEPEDIDHTLAHTLEELINDCYPQFKSSFDGVTRETVIAAWHRQSAWPEVKEAIRRLREDLGLEVFVHANGTTRLQLDLVRSSELSFNMLFSSQLLGVYKPSRDAYIKGLKLAKLEADQVIMVAAHAYDLRGAKECGMKTVYIHRWTDDVDEDMDKVKGEFSAFLENMEDLPAVISRLSA